MQVLVALADAPGRVVTRDTLFERCWGEIYVGDDSLNRTVGAIRKLAVDIAGGSFRVETIRRTGYRLIVEESANARGTPPERGLHPRSSRRIVIGSGLALAVLAAGSGIWWRGSRDSNPKFDDAMRRGEDALRLDDPRAATFFEQATALEPRSARAWGLLAYVLGSGLKGGANAVPGPTALAAERAARNALQIDPSEPNALLAMTFFESDTHDWISRESSFRRILALDPSNVLAMRQLGMMLHGVGRCREALSIANRALAIEPLTPDLQMRKAMRLWTLGRVTEADPVIDRAMVLWPTHPLVRLARLMIYTYTGRANAAAAMVKEEEKKPIILTPAAAAIWEISLAAVERPTPSSIEAARKANLEGAKSVPQIAANAILMLSALHQLDDAFAVANGFLLGRGSVIIPTGQSQNELQRSVPAWRNTFGLFTPPTKAVRLDSRFNDLADGLGLRVYWNRRGIGPDAFLFKP